MPILQVVSSKPRAGKSTVAASVGAALARAGNSVQLLRSGSAEGADRDAAAFSELLFAAAPSQATPRDRLPSSSAAYTIIELEAADEPLEAPAVMVVRGSPAAEDEALGKKLGQALIGTIATVVSPGNVDGVATDLTNMGLRPLAVMTEDPRLASPSVEDIRHALAADVLFEGENYRLPIENVVVAPVYTDGAKLHFRRFPGARAVLTPSYKTDLILAAIEAEAACVIITGGHQPSAYVIDRAHHEPVTLLLAQHQTPAAVAALSDVWTASAFSGQAKVDAALSQLDGRMDWPSFAKKLA
jgi:BioD-like phosphotransacetylase family protein